MWSWTSQLPCSSTTRCTAASWTGTGGDVDGLLVHLARATDAGFQVVEVWESREHFDHYETEIVGPLLAGAGAPTDVGRVATAFDVRGLVVPRAGVAV